MNEYFKVNPYKPWFGHFENCLNRLGASFGDGMSVKGLYKNVAVSIDYFSAIATYPVFSKLSDIEKQRVDQRTLFFKLLKLLNPDIAIMSTSKAYFSTVFDTRNKIFEREGKTEIYRSGDMYAIWGCNIRGTPCVFKKEILTEWIDSMSNEPKEGVFWVMSQDKDRIANGQYYFLYDFCGQEGHPIAWKKQQEEHPELMGFDYEFFPRGRVWKNNGKAEKTYTIFIPRILNCRHLIAKVDKEFNLNGDYVVALTD